MDNTPFVVVNSPEPQKYKTNHFRQNWFYIEFLISVGHSCAGLPLPSFDKSSSSTSRSGFLSDGNGMDLSYFLIWSSMWRSRTTRKSVNVNININIANKIRFSRYRSKKWRSTRWIMYREKFVQHSAQFPVLQASKHLLWVLDSFE